MTAFRPTRIVIHPDVAAVYARVEAGAKSGRKQDAAIWRSFQHVIGCIRADGQWGEVVPKIPAHFVRRYAVANLYCVDLAFFHRAFYTIYHRDVIFLDLVDHRQYDRWFPSRRR